MAACFGQMAAEDLGVSSVPTELHCGRLLLDYHAGSL